MVVYLLVKPKTAEAECSMVACENDTSVPQTIFYQEPRSQMSMSATSYGRNGREQPRFRFHFSNVYYILKIKFQWGKRE